VILLRFEEGLSVNYLDFYDSLMVALTMLRLIEKSQTINRKT